MVKAIGFTKVTSPGNVIVELFADEKTDVVPGMTIQDLPDNYTIVMGSSVMTAAGEIAFMKSDGTWNWV